MKPQNSYVEHANISVSDPEETIRFITAAMPEWEIRGEGEMEWFGEMVHWYHVGDGHSYVAIKSGGSGKAVDWKRRSTRVEHIGIVVPDLDSLVERLADCGYEVDHFGPDHPFRKNAYFLDSHGLQFEFIQYFSLVNSEKNDYLL